MTQPSTSGTDRSPRTNDLNLEREQLPLAITYEGTKYVLVLTRSNKLLLQKPLA